MKVSNISRFLAVGLFLSLAACSSSTTTSSAGGGTTGGTSSGGSTGGTTTTTSSVTDTNALAVAYPDELAVTSILSSTSSSGALRVAALKAKNQEAEATDEVPVESFDAEKQAHEDLLTAERPEDVDVSFDVGKDALSADCYGPVLYYSGTHPDQPGSPVNGSLPPGDLGIWTATNDGGEACVAAKVNSLISEFKANLDAALEMAAAENAIANINDLGIPEAGESNDLAEEMNTVLETNDIPFTVDSASISRDAEDTAEGFPVFVSEVSGDIAVTAQAGGPGGQPEETEIHMEVTLEHIPEVENIDDVAALVKSQEADSSALADSEYCGRVTQKVSMPVGFGNGFNCGNIETTVCNSITYCKTGSELTYQSKSATFCGASDDVDCLDDRGEVDFDNKRTNSNPTGWGDNAYFTLATVNTDTGAGAIELAWQAGANDSHTRALNASIDADGVGCGYFGFGPDMTQSDIGTISGMICNWAGPGNQHEPTDTVQRQCYARNEETGLIEPTSSNITYAPTNSCDKSASSFAYGLQTPPTDVASTTATSNDLIPKTEMVFTAPTPPSVE